MADSTEGIETPPFNGDKKTHDIFFGLALTIAMGGLCAMGYMFWTSVPQYESGAILVTYTFTNVVSFILGAKSGLATPPGSRTGP